MQVFGAGVHSVEVSIEKLLPLYKLSYLIIIAISSPGDHSFLSLPVSFNLYSFCPAIVMFISHQPAFSCHHHGIFLHYLNF
jgi:hypothetical protein